eukprot:7628114-Karenia_brevis.AAC.1
MLKVNLNTHGDSVLDRIKRFVNHVQQSSDFNGKFHDDNSSLLEETFHCGQDETKYPLFSDVSVRPQFLFESAKEHVAGGAAWKKKYFKHCQ